MRTRQADLDQLNQGPQPTKPDKIAKRKKKLASLTKLIAEDKQAADDLRAVDPQDRDAVAELMNKWQEGGMYTASVTKFTNEQLMEQAINKAVTDNMPAIEAKFLRPDGTVADAGANLMIRAQVLQNLGIGYELDPRNQIVKISRPLTTIVAIIVLVDSANGHFVVETAYPE
jgi:hypothetical protein